MQTTPSRRKPAAKATRLENQQAGSLANGGKGRRSLPAVHRDRVVARLLLLLLDSCNQVDHPFSFGRNPDFWPPVEMELPNEPALLLLVTLHAGKQQIYPAVTSDWKHTSHLQHP